MPRLESGAGITDEDTEQTVKQTTGAPAHKAPRAIKPTTKEGVIKKRTPSRRATPKVSRGLAPPKRAPRLRPVTEELLTTAKSAGALMDAAAPVRRGFVRADAAGHDPLPEGERTPLSKMLAGGQGGEVRLKLYLSLLWLGARKPYSVEGKPANAWARLFGLGQPDTNGAHRVGAAIDWLVANGFVLADRQKGRASRLTPCLELGGGAPYTRPHGDDQKPVEEKDWYFQLPQELWSMGWMGVLSGAALAALVVLYDETWGRKDVTTKTETGRSGVDFKVPVRMPFVWLAEKALRDRYRISYDLWEKGTAELAAWDLVERRYVSEPAGFGPRHRRRRIRIRLTALKAGPEEASG